MSKQLKFVNENLEITMDESKQNINEILVLKENTEKLKIRIQQIKNSQGEDNAPVNKVNFVDTSKLLEINSFAEYVKLNNSELNKIDFRVDEFKRILDDFAIIIKEKITIKEVNSLDGINMLLNKIIRVTKQKIKPA